MLTVAPKQKQSTARLATLPRVLLSICFSYLPLDSHENIALVCKSWNTVEKDASSWPNSLKVLQHQEQWRELKWLLARLPSNFTRLTHLDVYNKWDVCPVGYVLLKKLLGKLAVTNLSLRPPFLRHRDIMELLEALKSPQDLQTLALIGDGEDYDVPCSGTHMPILHCRQLKLSGWSHGLTGWPTMCPAVKVLSLVECRSFDASVLPMFEQLETLTVTFHSPAQLLGICSALNKLASLVFLSLTRGYSFTGEQEGPSPIECLKLVAQSSVQKFTLEDASWSLPVEAFKLFAESKIIDLTLRGVMDLTGDHFKQFLKSKSLTRLSLVSRLFYSVSPVSKLHSKLLQKFNTKGLESTETRSIACCQPTFSSVCWSTLCEMTSLTKLHCVVVTVAVPLSSIRFLSNLTSLSLTLCEDFDQITRNPSWLSLLPPSLQSLWLTCGAKWVLSTPLVSESGLCPIVSTARTVKTFSQCLPHFKHLLNLKFLSLTLGGVVTATDIKHITHLPLHTLKLHLIHIFNQALQSRDWLNLSKEKVLKEDVSSVEALSQIRTLRVVEIDNVSEEFVNTCSYKRGFRVSRPTDPIFATQKF